MRCIVNRGVVREQEDTSIKKGKKGVDIIEKLMERGKVLKRVGQGSGERCLWLKLKLPHLEASGINIFSVTRITSAGLQNFPLHINARSCVHNFSAGGY